MNNYLRNKIYSFSNLKIRKSTEKKMLPKPKRDSSDPVDEELESLQGETPGDSLKNFSTTIGIIFFVLIIT